MSHSDRLSGEASTEGASHAPPLEVGVVLKPHGLRGEVKVKLHFAASEALEHAERVSLLAPDGTRTERVVTSVRGTSKGVLLALAGIDDCDAAERLRGHRVLMERSQLPPLQPGEYYLADLVGCTVHLGAPGTAEYRAVGVVQSVRLDPTVDTLVLETPEGDQVEQPLGDAWVGDVDVAARRIRLLDEDGLIR